MSQVGFSSPSYSEGEIRGRVGHYLSIETWHKVGMFRQDAMDQLTFERSLINDPEYVLLGSSTPPGLTWDESKGRLSGIPSAPGKWHLQPGVRDKTLGHAVYTGYGYRFTENIRVTGTDKIYIAPKEPIIINISE
jgi:hypothetical protein